MGEINENTRYFVSVRFTMPTLTTILFLSYV
nr:MAG TPA: capsid protein [Crassvirales sp.]